MWRHEDVFRTLGGGIDFVTGEWITTSTRCRAIRRGEPLGHALVLAPLMHGAAQWTTFGALFRGTTLVLLPKFDPHDVWAAVEQYRIGGLAITGDAMARPLIEALIEGSYDTLFRLLGQFHRGGVLAGDEGAVPRAAAECVHQRGGRVVGERVQRPAAAREGRDHERRRPHQRRTWARERSCSTTTTSRSKPGEVGRMARGGNVPIGYYKDPVKTAATFIEVDGKRYSVPGDFARLEEDGTMTLLGRGSQCINSGGEKIYPEEVEAALKAHPQVYDVLVVGVDDERWGQKVAAVVQPRDGARPTLDDLVEHCRTRIAGYKVPRALHLVDEIPRQPSGQARLPARTAPSRWTRRRSHHEESSRRDVRHRVPDLRLLALPRRGRRGHERGRHGRARCARLLTRSTRARAEVDRRARRRQALRRRRRDAGEDRGSRCRHPRGRRHRRAAAGDDQPGPLGLRRQDPRRPRRRTSAATATCSSRAPALGAGVLGWTEATGAPQIEIALGTPDRAAGVGARSAAEGRHRPGPRAGCEGRRAHRTGRAGAVRDVQQGVDIIIAQGYEAGGHTGEVATMVLVPDVVDAIAPGPCARRGRHRVRTADGGGHGARRRWRVDRLDLADDDRERLRRRRDREAAGRDVGRHGAVARRSPASPPASCAPRGPKHGRRPNHPARCRCRCSSS